MASRQPSLRYERRGSGEPLVLIHGLGGTRFIWTPVLGRLAETRDVIAVDMPGFGDSPRLPQGVPASAANLGAAVIALCSEIGVERPHVAGNSLGGWVALEIARAGGAASVCAISPAGLWADALGPRNYNPRRLGRLLKPALRPLLSSAATRSRLLGTTMAHPERMTAAEATALISGWLDSSGYDAANQAMRNHVFENPGEVTVPTTIAWGDRDRLVAPPRTERVPPGSRFVVLEGCGHTPTWDDPEAVSALLLEASSAPEPSPAL